MDENNMDRAQFFQALRADGPFGAHLSQGQVAGIEVLLTAMARLPISYTAYLLATACHETAHTMRPVRETLADTDDQAIARLEHAWAKGDLPWVRSPYWRRDADGKAWFGRGYVQLTHKENYQKAGAMIGADLASDPDRALDPDLAARILVDGCETGLFTRADGKPGHKLSDYLPGDYVGARRIVNGSDRAQTVAGHALAFEAALAAGGYGPVQAGTPPEAPPGGLSAWVSTLVKSLTGGRDEAR